MGTWECMKSGELPWHNNTLGVFVLGEIPQNTSRNKKGGVHVGSERRLDAIGAKLLLGSFILSRSKSEMLSMECWNVWKLVIFSS
jgi:hypothetical protein